MDRSVAHAKESGCCLLIPPAPNNFVVREGRSCRLSKPRHAASARVVENRLVYLAQRARAARWTLAGSADGGGALLLDVAVGGPPCDAVTAVDVMETAERVTVSVYAGATASASCGPGVPAMVGTVRVPAHLSGPLGARTLVDGATR
jgi:hypothetical protein